MLPPIASRFVAGETPEEALAYAREQEDAGIRCLLNLLGEHYTDPSDAVADREAYQELIAEIAGRDIDAAVSVKPSQLGLDIDEETFHANMRELMGTAMDHGVTVWIDMEDHTTTDATLAAYREHVAETDTIGICLQANLRRTPDDIQELAGTTGHIRLVKGAYDEPEGVAYRDQADVDEQYRYCLELLFSEFAGSIAVGSHDPAMIEHAGELADQHDRPVQYQLLMGVRTDAQRRLAEDHAVAQYVPYGPDWFAYFYRRLRERKQNVIFALRALVPW